MLHGLAITVLCAWSAMVAALVPPVSDPVAVQALVTEVELLPDAEAPRAVRVHGAFALPWCWRARSWSSASPATSTSRPRCSTSSG